MVEALQGVISLSSKVCLVQACHCGDLSHGVCSKLDICLAYVHSLGECAVWVGLCQQPKVNRFSNLSITTIAVVWGDTSICRTNDACFYLTKTFVPVFCGIIFKVGWGLIITAVLLVSEHSKHKKLYDISAKFNSFARRFESGKTAI